MSVRVSVLGSLIVDGGPISPRERTVLAVLVMRAGIAVAPEAIADAVWGEHPPATWSKQVQIAIARLRRHAGAPPIATVADGYLVDLGADELDASQFERFVAEGEAHESAGEPDRADAAFGRSLGLWRGRAYADLPDWPPAIAEAQRLAGLRDLAEEGRLRVRLALGQSASVVGDAERLVQAAPMRERRWAILALALYHSGRQAESLAAIREARRRLDDELGIDLSDDLAALETSILRHDAELDAPPEHAAAEECPYRGLDAFDVDDEAEFFGRSREILAALARIEASTFVAFAGPSGCGKSSLVRAGVIPALRRQGRRVEVLLPRRAVAASVRDVAATLGPDDVLFIDQFEEILHLDLAASALDEIGAALTGFIEGGGTLILSVRSDFLDDCAELPHLGPAFSDGVQLVPPIDAAGLREAIEAPARLAGLRLEAGLTELILRDAAGRSGTLPHVSHALVETWLRREGATMTVAGYEDSGGISGAIAQSADRLYERMTGAERALCRSTMLRLIAVGADGTPVRRSVALRSLHDDAGRDHVLAMLAEARLVSADETTVVVAHEALADAWPRLRGWLDDDADALRTMQSLATAAETWSTGGRLDEDHYRGARLETALEWRHSGERDLTAGEAEFLAVSAARAEHDRHELAERERHERRQNRRLRGLLVAASALIVLLIGAGTFAGIAATEAERQRTEATIEALVSTALSLTSSERDVAALLAAEAYRRWPDDPRARSGLMGILTGAGGFLGNAFVEGTDDTFGAVIPGTGTALIVTGDGSSGIRDLETAELEREIDLGLDSELVAPGPLVEVSADGRYGAVLWPTGVEPGGVTWYGVATESDLVVVDLATDRRTLGPVRLPIGTGALAVAPDGTTVAIADARDGRVSLVDTATGIARPVAGELPVVLDRDSLAAAATFDASGRLLVGRLDDRLDVIDTATAAVRSTVVVPEASAHVAMDVTPSGILVASGDDAIVAVDLASDQVLWSHRIGAPSLASCSWITASELTDIVYCGGMFGRLTEYGLADGEPTGAQLDALLGGVGPLAVSADGGELVAISVTRAAISRWKLDGGGPVSRLIAPGAFAVGGYSHAGSLILTAPRPSGARNDGPFLDLSVRDTATDVVQTRFTTGLADPAWTGESTIAGFFADTDRLQFASSDDGSRIGEPPDHAFRTWTSSDGRHVYVARDVGERVRADTVTRVDPVTGEARGPVIVLDGLAAWVTESPDGRRVAILALAGGGRITSRVFDAATGELMNETEEHISMLLDDREMLVFDDNRIARYDSETLEQLGTLPGTAGGLGVPTLSQDGRTLLVTSGDQSVMLYDMPSGIRLAEPLRADSPDLTGAQLRPDGRELAVNVAEGVMIWDLDPEHQLAAVCRIAGRNLTPDEWRTYLAALGDVQETCPGNR